METLASQEHRRRVDRPPQDKPMQLLVIDDSIVDRVRISSLLNSQMNAEIVFATRLSEGAECLAQTPFDVVVLDLNLPDSQGLETFFRLHRKTDIPIVVLTGLEDSDSAVDAVRAGAEDYLFKDELDAQAMTRALRYAVERAGRRRAETALRARQHELEFARRTQQALFPKRPPSINGYELAGASFPSEYVGGDYFDFFPMMDQAWGIAVGDASGHGLGPAIMMAETRAAMRALLRSHRDVGQIITLANEVLFEGTPDDTFVTLFIASLEPSTGTIRYSSAGHPSALLMDAQGDVRATLPSCSPPLGVFRNLAYTEGEPACLLPGETLVLYSDGFLEAVGPAMSHFGSEGLERALRKSIALPASEIVHALHQRVLEHCDGGVPPDDMTVVVIKRL